MSKLLTATVLFVTVALSGCGSTTEVTSPTVSVSIGQQLIDLKKARDSGAVTEADYRRNRQQLIDNVR